MVRILLTIIFLLAFLARLSAQTIFEQSDTSRYVFSYVPYERSTNNKVINQLALAHLKVPEKTSFTYSFRHRLSINFRNSDSLFIMLDVKSLNVTGDKLIKDFDIQKLLRPSRYDISINIEDPLSGNVFNESRNVIMDNGIVQVTSIPDSVWKEGIKVELRINSVSFTEEDYRRIELELTAIRDYYASAALGDTLLKNIQKARRNTTDFSNAIKLYVTSVKGLYLLKQSIEQSSEIVPGRDPLNVASRNKLIHYNFEEYISHLTTSRQPHFTGNVYKEFAGAYVQSLKEANKLSQKVDYYSSPFFYKLYSNSITSSQLLRAEKKFLTEVKRRGVGNFNATRLMNEIMHKYISESEVLLAEDRYVEAVDLLSGAEKLKNLSPYDQVSGEVEDALAYARKGLIYSYTEIMQKALDKNLVTLAEKYLTEVENYIARYGVTNTETGLFREIYIRMADIHAQIGRNAFNKDDFHSSLAEYSKALELLSGLENGIKLKINDGILMNVRSIYNHSINEVDILLHENKYEEAEVVLQKAEQFALEYPEFYPDKYHVFTLQYRIAALRYNSILTDLQLIEHQNVTDQMVYSLIEANDLRKKYDLPDNEQLEQLKYTIGIRHLNDLFTKGRLKHWASEPDSALLLAGQANAIATRLNLGYVEDIKRQYAGLMEQAGETYCKEAKKEFYSMLEEANRLFIMKKFSDALNITNQARELVYLKSSCGLTTMPINKLLLKYENHIKWHELVTQALVLIDKNEFQQSIHLIQKAESIYTYYKLDTSGIANIGYFDLAMESNNTELLKHAIGNQISRSKFSEAFQLLERLRIVGYPAEKCSHLQETLARNLALQDKAGNNDLNVNGKLQSYTNGNKWYTRFDVVYRYYTRSEDNSMINRSIKSISDELKNLF